MKTKQPRRKILSRPHSMYSLRCYDDAMAKIDAVANQRSVPRSQVIRDAIDFFLERNIIFTDNTEPGDRRRQATEAA